MLKLTDVRRYHSGNHSTHFLLTKDHITLKNKNPVATAGHCDSSCINEVSYKCSKGHIHILICYIYTQREVQD
jgi:hypothetical protein